MATITVPIPEDMQREMDEVELVDWKAIAREAIRKKLSERLLLKELTAKSKLTEVEAEEFALELGRKINRGIHERHLKEYGGKY